jgi:hypothetical protein
MMTKQKHDDARIPRLDRRVGRRLEHGRNCPARNPSRSCTCSLKERQEIERLRERLIYARAAVAQARIHFLAGEKEGGWTLCALRLALDEIDGGLHDPVPNA